jgi:hypothetical protein
MKLQSDRSQQEQTCLSGMKCELSSSHTGIIDTTNLVVEMAIHIPIYIPGLYRNILNVSPIPFTLKGKPTAPVLLAPTAIRAS